MFIVRPKHLSIFELQDARKMADDKIHQNKNILIWLKIHLKLGVFLLQTLVLFCYGFKFDEFKLINFLFCKALAIGSSNIAQKKFGWIQFYMKVLINVLKTCNFTGLRDSFSWPFEMLISTEYYNFLWIFMLHVVSNLYPLNMIPCFFFRLPFVWAQDGGWTWMKKNVKK